MVSSIHIKEINVEGRKIALNQIRKSLLEKHEDFMGKDKP